MVCVYCGGKTSVINSRSNKKLNRVWRRRQCTTCHSSFTTAEHADEQRSFMIRGSVTKKLVPFSRDKLFISLYRSCGHRQTAVEDAAALSDTIISQLLYQHQRHNALLTRSEIKQAVARTLKHFDQAAATYYQAYYMD